NTPPTITTGAPNRCAFANGLCQAPVPDFTCVLVAPGRPSSTLFPYTTLFRSGTPVGLGVTTVTLHVKDGATNESTCTATFTVTRSEEHTSELQSRREIVFRHLLEQTPVPDFTSGVVATDCNSSTPLSITQTPT